MSRTADISRRLVDGHAHFLPLGLPDLYARTGDPRWPRLSVDEPGDTGLILRGPDVFRRVRRACWDARIRVDELDRHEVAVQIVSPVPVTLVDWADADLAVEYLGAQNDRIAETVGASGGRLAGLAAVPLQDVDAAIAEMRRATSSLGLSGVEIGTVVGGRELDDPALRPFFAAAAQAGVPLFIHPVDGSGATRCTAPMESFAIGMLTDTAIAAAALIFGGVLAEVGDLRVCLSHGGGSFPWVYPRLRTWATTIGRDGITWDGRELDRLVKTLHVDSLVFDPAHLPLLVERFGAGHLLFGSDDPFIGWDDALRSVPHDPPAVADAIATGASAFYRLDPRLSGTPESSPPVAALAGRATSSLDVMAERAQSPDLERLAQYPTTKKQREFDWDFLSGVDGYEVWDELEIGTFSKGARVFVVAEEDILSFNRAALETDPLLVDSAYAASRGGILPHPLFVVQIVFYCIDTGVGSWIRSAGARNPGQTIELFEPFRVGEHITATITHWDKWIRRGNFYAEDKVDLHNETGTLKATWYVRLLLPPTRAELQRWASV